MNGRTKRDAGDSDVLRRRNQALAARVKELEIELAKAKSSAGVSPAASGSDRRTDDEETVYSRDHEDNSLVEAFGTLTIEAESGRTTWHGKSSCLSRRFILQIKFFCRSLHSNH